MKKRIEQACDRATYINKVMKFYHYTPSGGNVYSNLRFLRSLFLDSWDAPIRFFDIRLPRTSIKEYNKKFDRIKGEEKVTLQNIDISDYEDWLNEKTEEYRDKTFGYHAMWAHKAKRGKSVHKLQRKIQITVNEYISKIIIIRLALVDIQQNFVGQLPKRKPNSKK
jgi:hypothetical protein